jgi:hypothetical protein
MLPEYPIKIPRLPSMVFVRDLEVFEGPVLSEMRGSGGRSTYYLDKWCTSQEDVSRSIVVRTEQRAIAEYLSRRITMRSLMLDASDGIGFVVDRRAGDILRVFLVSLEDFAPESYLPKDGVWHDETLRPLWSTLPQSFLINEIWDGRTLAHVETLYHDVAGFSFLTDPASNRELPSGVLKYEYDRGFPIGTAFARIRASVPHEYRAKSAGVAAGSPGVLTLEAPASTARRLAEVLAELPRGKAAYEAVYSWSRTSPKALDRMPNLDAAKKQIWALCARLKVQAPVLLPPDEDRDPVAILNAGKLIAAFYRKLWAVMQSRDSEFISAKVEGVGESMPPPEEDDDEPQE